VCSIFLLAIYCLYYLKLSYFNYIMKILLKTLDVVSISNKTCQQHLMLINIYFPLSLLNSFTENTKWFQCMIFVIPIIIFLSSVCNVKVTQFCTMSKRALFFLRFPGFFFFLDRERPSPCVLSNLYNVLCTVDIQHTSDQMQ